MEPNYFPNEELNTLPCGVVVFSNHTPWRIVFANEFYYNNFANDNCETLNIIADDSPRLNSLAPRLAHGEKSANLLYRAMNGKNEMRVVMAACRFGEDALLGVLWDATERSKMIDEMEKEKEKFAMALCNSRNVVFEHNLKKKTQVFYVPNMKDNTVETIRQSNVTEIISEDAVVPDQREFFVGNLLNPEEKVLAAQIRLPHEKSFKWYRVTRQFEYDENGSLSRIFGVMVDIEAEKEKEKEMRKEMEIDKNLGIYNRDAAVKRIESYIAGNPDRRDYALLVMDIDNFKNINDTYGHLYGDAIIEKVAHVLSDLRPNFSIPGRYGGDEFFIFFYAADAKEAKENADKILVKLVDIRLPNNEPVTCSIGMVLGEQYNETPDYRHLFEKADKALYAAKSNGKAQWLVYHTGMDESSGRAIDYEIEDKSDEDLMEQQDLMKVFLELSSSAKTNDDALNNILKYITAKFDFDWMQIMEVNSKEDLISIRYDWSRDPNFSNSAGKSGYYVHSDIMLFRNHFEKNPIFELIPENTEGFSHKFQREFEKNKYINTIYISDTTADDTFYMFSCVRFDKKHVWKQDEMEGLNVATKIMAMFIAQAGKESKREIELQREVDIDRRTGLYSMDKFYVELGRLRKLAQENNEDIVIFHTEFGGMMNINLKYGYAAGDDVIQCFGSFIRSHTDRERSISGHVNGTDAFLRAFRINHNDFNLIKKYRVEHERFCDRMNKQYKGAHLVIRTGIYVLPPGEEGGVGFNKAYYAVKREKDKDRCMFEWYEDKTKPKLGDGKEYKHDIGIKPGKINREQNK